MSNKSPKPALKGSFLELPRPLPVRISPRATAANLHWPEITQDLIEVACAILLADRLHLRPAHSLQPRHIALRIPVRHPQLWEGVVPELRRALEILADDTFIFEFYYRPQGASCFPQLTRGRQSSTSSTEEKPQIADRIVLFSGGLDSAAAAANLAQSEVTTAYVTQYVYGIDRINGLLKAIYGAYGGETHVEHAQFYISPTGPIVRRLREHSRRTRSFLFVSLALATAHAMKAREVLVCENGVLALNLPFTPAMLPTRHAHSLFLKTMEELAGGLFQTPIKVINPFELQTKGEMSRVFIPHPKLALQSVSCWNQQWSGRGKNYGKGHCGHCVPCLVRRISLKAAGIAIPGSHFDLDIRRLARKRDPSQKELSYLGSYRALMSFRQQVRSLRTWRQFLRSFPDIINSEASAQSLTPERWFKNVFDMMQRFLAEVEGTFGED
jgi:7-cyano-7-deazaguanine synthase in queuosine biosynthesis